MIKKRLIADLLIFLGLFALPWWGALIFIIVGLLVFSDFYEGMFFGLILDSIYNVNFSWLFGFRFGFSFLTILLFLGSRVLRRRLKFYNYNV